MSNRENILTPVGRLVQGSLYEPSTKDAEGNMLSYKTGAQAGQPKLEFYFALAIPKGNEQHWAQTEWGKKIYDVGVKGFPNGAYNSPTFAWKIKDGDSAISNRKGRAPKDCEGFAGHWVLSFKSGFAPKIYNENGSVELTEVDHVKLGDYLQVYGAVSDNESQQQPGVYLNHNMVALAGFGTRIVVGVDPKEVGFGNAPLPAGASKTPIAQAPGSPPVTPAPYNPPPATPAPPPYPQIMTPPAPPAAPVRVMLPPANGISYEQYIANGWTDALLVQHGYMQP